MSTYQEKLSIYDSIVALCSDIKRKGKTMPYTSDNGYMFSLLNKAGELGIRLPKATRKVFIEKYDSGEFKSHGAVIRDYVIIPDQLLSNKELIADYLKQGHEYVLSLPPK